ncbi:unnamed protein product, partial [Gulo gulo]
MFLGPYSTGGTQSGPSHGWAGCQGPPWGWGLEEGIRQQPLPEGSPGPWGSHAHCSSPLAHLPQRCPGLKSRQRPVTCSYSFSFSSVKWVE